MPDDRRKRPAGRPQVRRSMLTSALYRRMIANPDQRIPFVLVERG